MKGLVQLTNKNLTTILFNNWHILLNGKGRIIGENVKKFFSFSLKPFVLLSQLFNLSFILEISEIFAALIPVFSIYKTLFFCL